VEDQPTDTGDLTDTHDVDADTTASTSATPVGKRGRHRSFRPRSVTGSRTDTVESAEQSATETTAEATDVDTDAVEETKSETPTETVSKPKRRRWFRGHKQNDADTETADAEAADAVPGEEPEEAEAPVQPKLRIRKPVTRAMTITVAVAAALFVAAGAFAGAMLQPYLSDRVVVDTKLDIARTATKAITTLFTYTPEDMDQLSARSSKFLGGDLKDEYAKLVDASVAANKQQQVHRTADVVGAAVVSLSGADATAMVYVNVTSTTAASKGIPKINLVTYWLNMKHKSSHWLITKMLWVTSKDLTKVG